MDVREVDCKDMNWMNLDKDRWRVLGNSMIIFGFFKIYVFFGYISECQFLRHECR